MNSMFESEVEFFTSEISGQDRIKSAIWDDAQFTEYVLNVGLEGALYEVSDFHANIASQLKARGITSPQDSDWAHKTISLCIRLKSRRQQLRKAVRESDPVNGPQLVADITAEVKEDWGD